VEYLFSIASRDELWSGGALVESRTSHGEMQCRGREIDAIDRRDERLLERAESAMEPMRRIARELVHARVRLVSSARRVNEIERDESAITIAIEGVSIVTGADNALHDVALLPTSPSPRNGGRWARGEGLRLPILWQNGSASVLLHEAAGHAAEHGHEELQWPEWLTVHDEPDFAIDDEGQATSVTDLKRETPKTHRRESFTDVALPRMTTLIARQHGAPWQLPEERIDIHLIAGGAYEPLTQMVTLSIAFASIVRGGVAERLAPFQLRAPRRRIVAAIRGAAGEPLRYPGVICSREGQEVLVGSRAPLMITEPL